MSHSITKKPVRVPPMNKDLPPPYYLHICAECGNNHRVRKPEGLWEPAPVYPYCCGKPAPFQSEIKPTPKP